MDRPSLKPLLARRDAPALGHLVVEFATPGIGHILAGAGCDFCFLDMEHSGFSFDTVKATLRHLHAAGVPTMVRTPSHATDHIARALDMGADGVILPMVESAIQAEALVRAAKYPPEGRRGVALGIAHDDYDARSPAAALAAANARVATVAMVETEAGAREAAAIAAVPGLDCLWVGHFDLSASLGVPGEFGHPRFRDAIARIADAAREHGRALGVMVGSQAEADQAWADGFRVLAYSGDVWLLRRALGEALAAVRGRFGGAPV